MRMTSRFLRQSALVMGALTLMITPPAKAKTETAKTSARRQVLAKKPLAAQPPSAQRPHIGFGPGLIDEDEPLRIDLPLIGFPARPLAGDVRPVLLTWQNGFFEAQTFATDE